MPSPIPGERVPFMDPKTGLVSRAWFNFFLSLFNLTGSAQNSISLSDVQVGPPTPSVDDLAALSKTVSGFNDGILSVQQDPPVVPDYPSIVGNVTATLDFPSTGAGASSDLTVTVPNAALGDVVELGIPQASVVSNSVYFGWVSATNTVTVRFLNNNTSTASDPASGTFRVVVKRY